jgi:hypothetical protein
MCALLSTYGSQESQESHESMGTSNRWRGW